MKRLVLSSLVIASACGGGVPGGSADASGRGSGGSTASGGVTASGGSSASGGASSASGGGGGGPAGAPDAGAGSGGGASDGSGGRGNSDAGLAAASGTDAVGSGGLASGGIGGGAPGGTIGDSGGAGAGGAVGMGTIYSGVPWFDTDGNIVNAHGPGFLKVGNTWYMVGEQRSGRNDSYTGDPMHGEDTFTGISMYSTTDFVGWTFVGTVVKPISGTVLAPPYYGERPKILYNATTSKYVIYIKMLHYTGSPPDYVGYYAVLTSSNIGGPYAYQGNLSPTNAGDFQVFQDTDGTQYLGRDAGQLYRLSSDGLSLSTSVASGIQSGEGVSLYRAGNTYFWQSSKGDYWHAGDNSYATATSLNGAWTQRGTFCPTGTKTWQSQDTAVVSIAGSSGTTYIYVGDRWTNGDLPSSTLVVQPMMVSGSSESIPTYNPAWTLDVAAGTWAAITPTGTSIDDAVTGTGPNQFDYSSGWTSAVSNGAFGNDLHTSSSAGATATISFTGTQVLLYSAYNGSSGIMGVTLADSTGKALTPEARVSLRYDAPAAANYLVYASPIMPRGSYKLIVRVTGKKDLYSSGSGVSIDRVLILGGS